jgi:hypothetical protein
MNRLEALALTLTMIAATFVLVLDMFVWRPL